MVASSVTFDDACRHIRTRKGKGEEIIRQLHENPEDADIPGVLKTIPAKTAKAKKNTYLWRGVHPVNTYDALMEHLRVHEPPVVDAIKAFLSSVGDG